MARCWMRFGGQTINRQNENDLDRSAVRLKFKDAERKRSASNNVDELACHPDAKRGVFAKHTVVAYLKQRFLLVVYPELVEGSE